MGLHLSDREIADFEAATEVLVSPLEYPDVDAWSGAVLESSKRLFRGDRSMLTLPGEDGPCFLSPDLDPGFVEHFRALFAGSARDRLRAHDSVVESGLVVRRARSLEVWTNRLLAELAGIDLHDTPFYRDLLRPAGVGHGFGLTLSLPAGEAWLSLACAARDPAGLDEERTRGLLSLLLPAFRSGVALLTRLHVQRNTLAATLDAVGAALALFDLRGRELHRNETLRHLVDGSPDAEEILRELRSLAGRLARSRVPPRKASPKTELCAVEKQVATRAASYRLQGGYLPAGAVSAQPAVLVLVQRLAPALPPLSVLRKHFRLTPAECRILPELAAGHTNAQIARRLGTSPNTVRNQLQSIFRRLGVRSRAGALSALSGLAGNDRPQWRPDGAE